MSDPDAKLVMMANQIAANLAHEADPAAATAEHIRAFWSPVMRAQFAAITGDRLIPTARAARARLGAAHG